MHPSESDTIAYFNAEAGTNMPGRISARGLSYHGSRADVRAMRRLIEARGVLSIKRFDDSAARAARDLCIITIG